MSGNVRTDSTGCRDETGQWKLFSALALAGTAAYFFSVKIPHTEAYIEGRSAFAFIGFALLGNWWMAILLALVLSVPWLGDISFLIGLGGNFSYMSAGMILIRLLYPGLVRRWNSSWLFGFSWFLLTLLCYQLFNTPFVWGILAVLKGEGFLSGMITGWRTQPLLIEAILAGMVSSFLMVAIRSNRHLRANQERLRHINSILLAIRNMNKLMVQETTPENLADRVCSSLTGSMVYSSARVIMLDRGMSNIAYVASSGFQQADENQFLEAIQTSSSDILSMIPPEKSPLTARTASKCTVELSRRLSSSDGLLGMITVEINGELIDEREEKELFGEIADDLAFALQKLRDLEMLRLANSVIERVQAVVYLLRNAPGLPVEYVSGNVTGILGFTAEDFLSGRLHYQRLIHPEDQSKVISLDRRAFDSGKKTIRLEPYRIITGDNHIKWVEETITVIRNENGKPESFQGVLIDVTDRIKAEEEHSRLLEQLAQSRKLESIGQLAGGIAHDFNNMLSVILGYSDSILAELEPNAPLRSKISEIAEAARRSADLTRQLLAFSRKETLQPRIVDLNSLIRNLSNMLGRLIGEHIELALVLSGKLSPVMIDPSHMEQVLINLAVNARDAMPAGGRLTIETENRLIAAGEPELECGEYVLLTVSDTGCGMDGETVSRIFEPFFTTKEKGKGTGMGLATVYGIVRQSEGRITVESMPGSGTVFRIFLPGIKGKPRKETDSRGLLKQTAGKHILVIEDERSLGKLLSVMLSSLGYECTIAPDGEAALELIRDKKLDPDLILTDVVMPGMSGRETVERIRQSKPGIRVLYMSGYTDDIIVHHGVLDRGVPFIQKPFSIDDLAVILDSILCE